MNKEAKKDYNRRYRAARRDELNRRNKQYQDEHRDAMRRYWRAYHQTHKDKKNAQRKINKAAFLANHPNYYREYYLANHERMLAQQRHYWHENRDQINARRKTQRVANPEKYRETQRQSYNRNIEQRRQRARDAYHRDPSRWRKLVEWYHSLREGTVCKICGCTDTDCLTWHHRDGTEKEFNVGQDYTGRSKAATLREIAKCDVLCANCHSKLHAELRRIAMVNRRESEEALKNQHGVQLSFLV